MTSPEFARTLGVTISELYRMIRKGEVKPLLKIGKKYIWGRDQIAPAARMLERRNK